MRASQLTPHHRSAHLHPSLSYERRESHIHLGKLPACIKADVAVRRALEVPALHPKTWVGAVKHLFRSSRADTAQPRLGVLKPLIRSCRGRILYRTP